MQAIGHAYLAYADDPRTASWPRKTPHHQGARERTWLGYLAGHSLHPVDTPPDELAERRLWSYKSAVALISGMPSESGGGEGKRDSIPQPNIVADALSDLFWRVRVGVNVVVTAIDGIVVLNVSRL